MEVKITREIYDFVKRNGESVKRILAKEGEVYEAKRYWIDPSKFTLLKRIPDGYTPEINVYSYECEIVK